MTNRNKSEKGWWKTALGEYPTGVTVISVHDDDPESADTAMVVGSFAVVSERPELISFMAMRGSRRFQRVAASGHFAASVLGDVHESLSRRLSMAGEIDFEAGEWVRTAAHGDPRLRAPVVWFSAQIVRIDDAGDHVVVTAEVDDFGIGDGSAGLPLLFLRGGYGSFRVSTQQFDVNGFSQSLRLAEELRKTSERFAEETGTECALATIVDDYVVVLNAANLLPERGDRGLVGMHFPFAAPMASALAAWGDEHRERAWLERSRHLLGRVDRGLAAKVLESVRSRGYALSMDETTNTILDRVSTDPVASREKFTELWKSATADLALTVEQGAKGEHMIDVIQVPVFDDDGHALFEFVVSGIASRKQGTPVGRVVSRAIEVAGVLTGVVGGRRPEGYPQDE